MKSIRTALMAMSVLAALNIVGYFYLSQAAQAQSSIMPSFNPPLLTNADATVRCLATGTTTVPSTPVDADQLVIMVDPDAAVTGNVLIQFTNDSNVKPATITSSTAHYVLQQGDSVVLSDPRRAYKWDARHLFAVGPSGAVVRVLRQTYRSNATPN
jgi:hypothetical protein